MNLCGLVSGDNDFQNTRTCEKKKKRLLWDEALEIQGGWDLETFFFCFIFHCKTCKLCILIHSLCCLWHKVFLHQLNLWNTGGAGMFEWADMLPVIPVEPKVEIPGTLVAKTVTALRGWV